LARTSSSLLSVNLTIFSSFVSPFTLQRVRPGGPGALGSGESKKKSGEEGG
jgi:hypothetical protein